MGWVVLSIIAGVVSLVIQYYLIRNAVKNGTKQALKDMRAKRNEDESFTFEENIYYDMKQQRSSFNQSAKPCSSPEEKMIVEDVYEKYTKKKLNIDYRDTRENQLIEVEKIIQQRLNEQRNKSILDRL